MSKDEACAGSSTYTPFYNPVCTCRLCKLCEENDVLVKEVGELQSKVHFLEQKLHNYEEIYLRDQVELSKLKTKRKNVEEHETSCNTEWLDNEMETFEKLLTTLKEEKDSQFQRLKEYNEGIVKMNLRLTEKFKDFQEKIPQLVCKQEEPKEPEYMARIRQLGIARNDDIKSKNENSSLQEQLEKEQAKLKRLKEQLQNFEKTNKSLQRLQFIQAHELASAHSSRDREVQDLQNKLCRAQKELQQLKKNNQNQEERRKLEHSGFICDFKALKNYLKKLESKNLINDKEKSLINKQLSNLSDKLKQNK